MGRINIRADTDGIFEYERGGVNYSRLKLGMNVKTFRKPYKSVVMVFYSETEQQQIVVSILLKTN